MTTPRTANRRLTTLRFRKNDPEHNLLAAVQHFVQAHGGALVVVGGIELQHWDEMGAGMFRIAVRCAGRPPRKMPPRESVFLRDERTAQNANARGAAIDHGPMDPRD